MRPYFLRSSGERFLNLEVKAVSKAASAVVAAVFSAAVKWLLIKLSNGILNYLRIYKIILPKIGIRLRV